jgi:hypothetical protein
MITMAFAAILAAASAPGLSPEDAQCRILAYAADGTRTETPPSRPYSRPSAVSMNSTSEGRGSSHVSVSSSSSASSGGASVVRATTDGRTITKTYDDKGCTVVIDARPDPGAGR